MKNWTISEVVAVCAIASPVLVTFINVIFKSHSEKINHRLAALNASIKSKQSALNQISKAYSIFVIEGHNNDKKDLELSVRQNSYLRHEKDFYDARDVILKSIASDKLKIYKLTTSKIYRICSFSKKVVIHIWAWLTSRDVRSKIHKEYREPKQ